MREVHSISEGISVNCCHSIAYGLVSFGPMISFGGVFMGMTNDKLVISCCCYTHFPE